MHEGLRLGYGVVTRLARIPEEEPLVYTDTTVTARRSVWDGGDGEGKRWVIPAGTAVGMSAYHVHHDEGVFPRSREYVPERWLDGEGGRERGLEGALLSFSKGSRQCIGMK